MVIQHSASFSLKKKKNLFLQTEIFHSYFTGQKQLQFPTGSGWNLTDGILKTHQFWLIDATSGGKSEASHTYAASNEIFLLCWKLLLSQIFENKTFNHSFNSTWIVAGYKDKPSAGLKLLRCLWPCWMMKFGVMSLVQNGCTACRQIYIFMFPVAALSLCFSCNT